MRQVFSISSTGAIAGLQVKPGQGFDLRALGKQVGSPATITRASEIVWDETRQSWRIELREGAGQYAGHRVTVDFLREEIGQGWLVRLRTLLDIASFRRQYEGPIPCEGHTALLFDEYDEAVKAEIAVLDCLREMGKL